MTKNRNLEELQQELAQARERIAALTVVQDVARDLTSELNLQRLLEKIVRSAVAVLEASAGSLLLWDASSNELVFTATQGVGESSLVGRRMPAYKGIAGWVFCQCQSAIVNDVQKDERFFSAIDESLGHRTNSLIAVPLIVQGKSLGVIEILNKRTGERFSESDEEVLSALASQAAVSIVNARLYQEVRQERDKLIALEEELRKGLARDFHDGPAQMLTSIIMDVEMMEKVFQQDPQQALEELDQIRKKAMKAIQQVRYLIFELRPLVLETQGLAAALNSYVHRLRQEGNLQIHLSLSGLGETLPPKIEETCFSVVQEAINNIKKHAGARNVWMLVGRKEGELTVRIRDDGVGFDPKQAADLYKEGAHLGMLSMRERVEMVGGQLSIKSVPRRGTTLTFNVSLPHENDCPSERECGGMQTSILQPPSEDGDRTEMETD